jgi:hypothetical protein
MGEWAHTQTSRAIVDLSRLSRAEDVYFQGAKRYATLDELQNEVKMSFDYPMSKGDYAIEVRLADDCAGYVIIARPISVRCRLFWCDYCSLDGSRVLKRSSRGVPTESTPGRQLSTLPQ